MRLRSTGTLPSGVAKRFSARNGDAAERYVMGRSDQDDARSTGPPATAANARAATSPE